MQIKSLDMLLKVKRRRIDEADERVKTQVRAVASAQQQVNDAEAEFQRCEGAENALRARIVETSSSALGFHASDVVTMQIMLGALEQQTIAARRGLDAARDAHAGEEESLATMRKELQRLTRQLEQMTERRAKQAALIDAEMEDTQDEESEEAAVARRIAARVAASREQQSRPLREP